MEDSLKKRALDQTDETQAPISGAAGAAGAAPQLATSSSPSAVNGTAKRLKLNGAETGTGAGPDALLHLPPRPESLQKGVAAIKPEYLIHISKPKPDGANGSAAGADENGRQQTTSRDDEAEAAHHRERDARDSRDDRSNKSKTKQKGQNTNRSFGSSRDAIALCVSRARVDEFSAEPCRFGDKCKYEHDIRKYLKDGKRPDLDTFGGACPIFEAHGKCPAGWRCRFAKAHSTERLAPDGRSELVLVSKDTENGTAAEDAKDAARDNGEGEGDGFGTVNIVPMKDKTALRKRQIETPKADAYTAWLNKYFHDSGHPAADSDKSVPDPGAAREGVGLPEAAAEKDLGDRRASYIEAPFRPSEKRRIYYGPETPVLAPLTTQGNLPYRRLCVELGAQVTWSEMAMSLPLIQGEKSEWALLKAHETETRPPRYNAPVQPTPVLDYDNSRDSKFGAQLAGNKPWVTLKAAEVITKLCPHLRAIDLNCGCPIDLIYKQGAGSALLDSPAKLEKILRGMNSVSGEVPVTVKIRMGTKDSKPTADRLVDRLAYGGPEARDAGIGPAGVAAITLHGRSRQQRYTRSADWSYIAECASIVKAYNAKGDTLADTVHEPDARDMASPGRMYFIGNGDCYSHLDYYEHIAAGQVDSVMVARGALIKPWIFEEIAKGQYLDKSATERLAYVEKFARYGMDAWGSDEIGLGLTRRFLLEWLSFACRYVPVGLLEHRPDIQDRPPAYRGRDDLETLLSSDNYRDWIKISDIFLGPAHKDFRFEPKHRSNNRDGDQDVQAEG